MNESSHFNHHPQELTKLRKDVISREDVNITILKQLSLPENGTFLRMVIPNQTIKGKNHHNYLTRHSHLLS